MSRPLEYCREWVEEKINHCNEPAIVIIWGKLFPREALGPKCATHAAKYVPATNSTTLSQYAVFDLRKLERR